MIDRIEELLGLLAAEDEEEREDVPAQKHGKAAGEGAWTGARASDRAIGPKDQPEPEGQRPSDLTVLKRDNGAAKPRVVNRRSVTTGEIALERPEPIAGGLWKDGPVWTVHSAKPEINEAQKAALAGRTAQTGETLQRLRDGDLGWTGLERAAESAGRSVTGQAGLEQASLKGLYRQTVRGLRPAAPVLSPEQAGRSARAREPGSAASLAVDELDRAVRRDSRRYDGGMSIF